jgi:hypothetical protein
MNRQRCWLLQVWLLLIAPSPAVIVVVATSPETLQKILAVSVATVRSTPENHDKESNTVIHTHDLEVGKLRTDFVKHILSDRLKYVKNGRRMADFHTWIRKRGGDVTVLSTHGVQVDLEMTFTPARKSFEYDENNPHSSSLQVFTSKNDPFAVNRLDLDLPVNNLPNLYEGKPIHLIDELQPSLTQLFWRALQLSVKFSPVLSTTWLAVVSTKFRKVWYKWVAVSLGKYFTKNLLVHGSTELS